ncbi:MAG TPA: sigma-70 family RNA polymerase sigma factor [Pseudomonadota bacterium]|jgi:RNA polymerase sigma-70 factor (ECF subfamily)|nr:sigma-70 family RNA polymerase sigma factor [Pseudomonadota bacterium]HNF97494.1 sigma-70 family RNA polymerase sigma factor [Pseudomonadota bacterium]HNI58366.1 sigma-70 family RNA polymerase sigma factor [Pseudomonadota bacterium]HNK44658.1 sigma-70 family RNA polymerase sigma factor [Pseudomonadota bacterium]HNN50829.1 sigma-70 family RNA polymerase sigma factor [Pseudomonadota bacterium]
MNKPIEFLPLGASAERELVAGLCRGEAGCYRQLYDRFAPRVQRLLLRIFADPQLARDAVQSTFLIVFEKIDRFDGRSSLLTWITRIAINEAHGQRRKSARRPPERHDDGPLPPSPEDQHGDKELQKKLMELVQTLPEEKRTALLLFEIEGFAVAEIAEITGEPRGTVLARLSRTRAELQKELSAWCAQEPNAANRQVRSKEYV